MQQEFHAMLREAKANGQTVFLSSHVLSEVQQTADDIAILRSGRIVEQSTVAALRENALRHVRVVVDEADAAAARTALAASPGVGEITEVADADGTRSLTTTLDSHVDAFVKAIAPLALVDLTVEEPDLEETVLGFYGSEARGSEEER